MIPYVRRTLLAGIAVTLGVSVLAFSLLHLLPGDPVLVMLGDAGHPPERIAELRAELGLEAPVAAQYPSYVGNLLRGDLGRSIRSNRPVLDEIRQQAPNTLALTFAALGLAVVAAAFPCSSRDKRTSRILYRIQGDGVGGIAHVRLWST